MASKAKLSLLVFLLSLVLLSAASCLGQGDTQQGRDESSRDPQQEYLQCQRTCQHKEKIQQQQCQQRCEQRRTQQEREQQRDEQSPQREYQQCQRRCQQQQPGQQKQLCEQQCEERRRQHEREQQRDEQSPQREYQQCQRRCQQQPGQQQQQQCEQRCEKTRKQQEREQQRDEQSPQREYQQCQRRCQQQQPGQQQQQQCEQQCEERRKQQEREQQRDEQSPQREYQQCQRRCQQQQPGQQQQQQCEQRCEERRKQQEREQQRDEQSPQREYQQCQRRCQQQQPGQQQQQQCEQRCEERRKQQEREQQRDEQSPQRKYQQCQRRCQQQQPGQQQQQQCEQRCEERRKQQEREQRRDEQSPQREYQQCQRRCQQQQPGQQQQQCEQRCEKRRRQQEREQQRDEQHGNNPYFFEEESFIDHYRTQEGYMRVLPKFTEQSNLLRGIENYRLAIFQANPNTFIIPSHWDADAVLFVVKGKGTISLVRQQNRESYNLKQGDVLRIPVGSLVYMINRDNIQTLQIAKILVTVSTPGQVKEFFSSGDHESESFYRAFSNDILESAFNTPREKLDRLFGQQTQGVIIRASEEQVRELSRHASSSSEGSHFWPTKGGQSSGGPFNILNKRATYSNNYGQLYEVDGNDYRQLQDLDLGVSFANISQGGMLGPYYNTRSTKVLLVVEGNGRIEMACPHLSKQSQQQHRGSQEYEEEQEHGQGVHYEKVSAALSPRTVFIVPAGHPVAIVASDNQNLQIVAFEINAQENQRNFLAGKENVINQVEKVAMELGFNVPSSEVQEILNKQRESFFFPGPNQRQQQRGSHGLSILDFVGL